MSQHLDSVKMVRVKFFSAAILIMNNKKEKSKLLEKDLSGVTFFSKKIYRVYQLHSISG